VNVNLSADGKLIAGTWTQGDQSYPLHLTLATPDTLWSYSSPSAMSAPDPSFEVATIKPSRANAKNRGYSWRTRLFQARDHTIAELIQFAYQVRKRQIDGGPAWINELRFDVAGEPNAPGLPSLDQQRLMLRKLLAERFNLKVHIVHRDFPVYALIIHKKSPHLVAADPSGNHLLMSVREGKGDTTALQFSFTTMPEFTNVLMNFIPDRQIVDETGLAGRFNFTMTIPTSTLHKVGGSGNADKAAAFLFGVQQLGFKLVPKKVPLEVIVIDHLNKPTAN